MLRGPALLTDMDERKRIDDATTQQQMATLRGEGEWQKVLTLLVLCYSAATAWDRC